MKRRVFAILVVVAMVLPFAAAPVGSAADDPVQTAIEKGLTWLVGQQNSDGSWGTYEPVAHTGFAVVKLEERAFELGYASPFDDGLPVQRQM